MTQDVSICRGRVRHGMIQQAGASGPRQREGRRSPKGVGGREQVLAAGGGGADGSSDPLVISLQHELLMVGHNTHTQS